MLSHDAWQIKVNIICPKMKETVNKTGGYLAALLRMQQF
jgi:hypothetical protein